MFLKVSLFKLLKNVAQKNNVFLFRDGFFGLTVCQNEQVFGHSDVWGAQQRGSSPAWASSTFPEIKWRWISSQAGNLSSIIASCVTFFSSTPPLFCVVLIDPKCFVTAHFLGCSADCRGQDSHYVSHMKFRCKTFTRIMLWWHTTKAWRMFARWNLWTVVHILPSTFFDNLDPRQNVQ